MKVVVSQPLEPGTALQVRSRERFVLAEVRHCEPQGDAFHAGLEIKDVFELPGSEHL